jgi:hypothetical protein
MRKSIALFFSLCFMAVLATSAAAAPAASCISPSASLAAVLAPQPQLRTDCFEGASCFSSQDCANLCSNYSTATCVDGQCQYTYGGGSGGSGGTGGTGCNIPSPMECTSYQQCVCQRPSGIYDFGQCIGGYCQF